MSISRTIHKFRLGEQPKECIYWRSRSFEDRLRALEDIRIEYNSWKYHDQQGLQRVCRIVKRR
jgi:hypothetical protein